ncbi:hypothetical protein CVT24_002205 [Panaeolus cyanescens]|uniref:Uncharacterized protein n=1 Tax=Panaeolus cyanescens TaxID=181874 RepID=A0A409WJF6_9AGAR|nr:hypothetical protein CVT24_002205 [Panaeolus cyanescens]
MSTNRESFFPVLPDEHIIETTANIWVGEHPALLNACHSTLHRPTSNLVITKTSTLIGAVPQPTPPPPPPPIPAHLVPPRPRTRRGYRGAHPYSQAQRPERYRTTRVVGAAPSTIISSSVPTSVGAFNEAAIPVQGNIFLEPQNQSHVRYYDGYLQYPVGTQSIGLESPVLRFSSGSNSSYRSPPPLSLSTSTHTRRPNPASSQPVASSTVSRSTTPSLTTHTIPTVQGSRDPTPSFSPGNVQEVDRRQGKFKQQRLRTSSPPTISNDKPV